MDRNQQISLQADQFNLPHGDLQTVQHNQTALPDELIPQQQALPSNTVFRCQIMGQIALWGLAKQRI